MCVSWLCLGGSGPAWPQSDPDTSAWQTVAAEEYGLTLRIPDDWILDEDMMEKYGDTLSVSAPVSFFEPPIACGLRAYTNREGKPFDLDGFLTAISDEESYLEWLRRSVREPEIHQQGEFTLVSGQRAGYSIVSVDVRGDRWMTMNFDTAEGATYFHLQCAVAPEKLDSYQPLFMGIGQSLNVNPS